jgi:DNA helicase-2/ATP-dependent DNA helicase PcrA
MQTLTKEQDEAVALTGRRCCLIAGAGSGKTHTLVSRILHDSEMTDPAWMVVVTFTNAAAVELRERLEGQGLPPARFRHIGTLHSWATREANHRGADTQIATAKQISAATDQVKKRLGAMARNMSNPEAWRYAVEPPNFGNGKAVGLSIRAALKAASLTHHDLILADFATAVEQGHISTPGRIYVDEYQDSAPVDARIYDEMSKRGAALYFIGDPRQAIYGFRGATPQNLATAWDRADGRAILSVNFRSGALVCEIASEIASRMPGLAFGTQLYPATTALGSYQRAVFSSEAEEMLEACEWANSYLAEGRTVAILTRYNAQATALAGITRGQGIPTTCSADKAPETERETLAESIEKIQAWGRIPETPPGWMNALTALGVPFANQDALLPALADCREPSDLASLGAAWKPAKGKLAIATIHAAKGLEWDAVWFMGADAAAFPEQNEEAGRMAYVAVTRAKRHLTISHSTSRPQLESGKTLTSLKATPWITTA